MIYSPMPWKSFNIGSYYLRQTPLAKIVPDHKEASSLYEYNDVSIPMRVLDLLGQVKWRVNKSVLEVRKNPKFDRFYLNLCLKPKFYYLFF